MTYISIGSSLRVGVASVLALLVLATGTHAQPVPSKDSAGTGAYRQANVVTAEGDTLRGRVTTWTWHQTPDTIRFEDPSRNLSKAYRPSHLQSLRTSDGTWIVSREVTVDQVPMDPEQAKAYLTSDRPVRKKDTLFLEVIVDGPLRLYAKRGSRSRYYVEREGEMTELIERKIIKEDAEGRQRIVTNPRYRSQLTANMTECPSVQSDIEGVDLKLRSLREIVFAYNECATDGQVPYVRDEPPLWDLSFGLEVGISQRRLVPRDREWRGGYSIGALLHLQQAQGDRAWALSGRFGWSRQPLAVLGGQIDQTYLETLVLARYYVTEGSVRPYIEGGLLGAYSIQNDVETTSFIANKDPQRIEIGIAGGMGILLRSLYVGGRIETRGSYLGFERTLRGTLLVGYRFGNGGPFSE